MSCQRQRLQQLRSSWFYEWNKPSVESSMFNVSDMFSEMVMLLSCTIHVYTPWLLDCTFNTVIDIDIMQEFLWNVDCSTITCPLELVKTPVELYMVPSTIQTSDAFFVTAEAVHSSVAFSYVLIDRGWLTTNEGVINAYLAHSVS